MPRYAKVESDDEFSDDDFISETQSLLNPSNPGGYAFGSTLPPLSHQHHHTPPSSSSSISRMNMRHTMSGAVGSSPDHNEIDCGDDGNHPAAAVATKTPAVKPKTFDILGQNEQAVQTAVIALTKRHLKHSATPRESNRIPWNIKLLLILALAGIIFLGYSVLSLIMEGFVDDRSGQTNNKRNSRPQPPTVPRPTRANTSPHGFAYVNNHFVPIPARNYVPNQEEEQQQQQQQPPVVSSPNSPTSPQPPQPVNNHTPPT